MVTGDLLYNRRQAKQTWVSCLIVTLPIWFILNKLVLSNLLSERNQLAPCSKKQLLSLKWNLKSLAWIEPDSFRFNQLKPDSEAIISETLSNIYISVLFGSWCLHTQRCQWNNDLIRSSQIHCIASLVFPLYNSCGKIQLKRVRYGSISCCISPAVCCP